MSRWTAEHRTPERPEPQAEPQAEPTEALTCPASFAQRRLWFLQELAPDSLDQIKKLAGLEEI